MVFQFKHLGHTICVSENNFTSDNGKPIAITEQQSYMLYRMHVPYLIQQRIKELDERIESCSDNLIKQFLCHAREGLEMRLV